MHFVSFRNDSNRSLVMLRFFANNIPPAARLARSWSSVTNTYPSLSACLLAEKITVGTDAIHPSQLRYHVYSKDQPAVEAKQPQEADLARIRDGQVIITYEAGVRYVNVGLCSSGSEDMADAVLHATAKAIKAAKSLKLDQLSITIPHLVEMSIEDTVRSITQVQTLQFQLFRSCTNREPCLQIMLSTSIFLWRTRKCTA